MHILPLRLHPGQDLRAALAALPAAHGVAAAYILQGIGSLRTARLRYAGVREPAQLDGDLEILTLAGSLSPDGVHLHMSVSDVNGAVYGGHVGAGCIVRTTAEILLVLLPEYRFTRAPDAASGFSELVISPT